MAINEKLAQETGQNIHLYKEGVFWITYNQSAYALVQHKDLQVSKRYIKKIKSEIIRVGFPTSSLQYFFLQFGEPIVPEDFYIRFDLATPIDTTVFEEWKARQDSTPANEPTSQNKLDTLQNLLWNGE